jgi:hypothetical protein
MGQTVSGYSFTRCDTQFRNEFGRSREAMPANRESAGMFHRNQAMENHILKALTLRDLHNILRGTFGGLAMVGPVGEGDAPRYFTHLCLFQFKHSPEKKTHRSPA